jgi:hypothetical protein
MLSSQSLKSAGIEATYLNYTHTRSLKDKGFPCSWISARPRFPIKASPPQPGAATSGKQNRGTVETPLAHQRR